jgi:hypothetical protein
MPTLVTEDVLEETEMSANKAGHTAHTKSAEAVGLPGQMRRPIKVTMLGAGSGFTPTLVNDILRIPGEQGGTIALVDIDPELDPRIGQDQLESGSIPGPNAGDAGQRLLGLLHGSQWAGVCAFRQRYSPQIWH